MALPKRANADLEALIQRGIKEQRLANPAIFESLQPLTDEEYAQELADAKEIERVWDELDRDHPDRPKVSAADIVIADRGE